jgi:hypothetical protein
LKKQKAKLLDLKSDNPKSSNLIFLEAVLTENGQDAVALYQTLVDKHPKSTYADASLYQALFILFCFRFVQHC